jgi:hypothetical protein
MCSYVILLYQNTFVYMLLWISNRNDEKTVNVIAEACFHPVTKIKVTAIKFFLGRNDDEDNGSSSEVYPKLMLKFAC